MWRGEVSVKVVGEALRKLLSISKYRLFAGISHCVQEKVPLLAMYV